MGSNEPPVRLSAGSPRWPVMQRRGGQSVIDWLKGSRFLVFHVDIFLVAIAALLLLNVARSPDHIWVTGVVWRWGLLLVIHGMVALLIWLIGMLLSEERPGAGTYEAEWSAVSRPASGESVEPVIVDAPEPDGGDSAWNAPPREADDGRDDGWSPPTPTPAPAASDDWHAGFEQRTSWAETSASAWLARRRRERGAAAGGSDESHSDESRGDESRP